MDRRYQVFISSTFQDLEPARREVSQALLRANCFPSGMELFPAADEEQFEYVKEIIDQSDFYVLISAGRYGSIHPRSGLSYTEMEYDYAKEQDIPIIRRLHRDPFSALAKEFVEVSDRAIEQLSAFRRKLSSSKMVQYWSDYRELGQYVVLSLLDVQKRRPSPGWVRAGANDGWANSVVDQQEFIATVRNAVDAIIGNTKNSGLDHQNAINQSALTQLTKGIALDFNDILTSINGYCDLLLLRTDQGSQN